MDKIEEALRGANVYLFFTEWGEIKAVNQEDYKKLMITPLCCEGRNLYNIDDIDAGVETTSKGH